MKTLGVVLTCVVSILLFSSVALAVDLTDPTKVPNSYATFVQKEGKQTIEFGTGPIAYEPIVLDQILKGYGLTLQDPAKVPASYAWVVDAGGKKTVMFSTNPTMYEPMVFDQILKGYGR
jgi:hypothetical protein